MNTPEASAGPQKLSLASFLPWNGTLQIKRFDVFLVVFIAVVRYAEATDPRAPM